MTLTPRQGTADCGSEDGLSGAGLLGVDSRGVVPTMGVWGPVTDCVVLNAYSPRGSNPEWAGPIVGQAYDKIVVG